MSYLTEAFKKMSILSEADFNLSADGKDELKGFLDKDAETELSTKVIDMTANSEDELANDYIGKVILDCNICHSKIFKDKSEVEIDEDVANPDMECPYCASTDGYTVIGEVTTFCADCDHEDEESEEKVEVEVKDDIDEALVDKGDHRLVGDVTLDLGIKADKNKVDVLSNKKSEDAVNEAKLESKRTIAEGTYNGKYILVEGKISSTRDYTWEDATIYEDYTESVGFGRYKWMNRPWQRYTFAEALRKAFIEWFGEQARDKAEDAVEKTSNPQQALDKFMELIGWAKDNGENESLVDKGDHRLIGDIKLGANVNADGNKVDVLSNKEAVDEAKDERISKLRDRIKKLARDNKNESLEKIEIDTGDQTIEVEAKPNDENEDESEKEEETISPVSAETKADIELHNDEEANEVDIDIDEFDEDEFDKLGESYLKRCYGNVSEYKTTKVESLGNSLKVEGVITFNSGNQKTTNFVFKPSESTKDGKTSMIGENLQICKGKKAYTLTGSVNNGKFISESFNYNYRAKDATTGESKRIVGIIKSKH